MEPINSRAAVGSAVLASLPGTGSWAPDAEETEPRFKFEGFAVSLADLGRLIRSKIGFRKLAPPFFFDFFPAVDEWWSAMEMREKGKIEARHEVAARHCLSFVNLMV